MLVALTLFAEPTTHGAATILLLEVALLYIMLHTDPHHAVTVASVRKTEPRDSANADCARDGEVCSADSCYTISRDALKD